MSKKEINVYYKGSMQKIKYYGNLDENQIKRNIKQIFKINEPLEQIYFQDEDGDILILNDQIPSGLSIYVLVEPDAIPKNPSTELNIKNGNGNLVKFHWIKENTNTYPNNNLNVIINKYLYTTVNDNDVHPHVRSSCMFEKGSHFFVLRKPPLTYYSLLLVCDENIKLTSYDFDCYQKAIGIFQGYPEESEFDNNDLFVINLGILIDMDKKKCVFYDYDKRQKRKIIFKRNDKKEVGYEAPIDFQKAKVVAWIKRDIQNKGKIGITILNEGCIPIPDWAKL